MTNRGIAIEPHLAPPDGAGGTGPTRRDVLKAGSAGAAAVALGAVGLGTKLATAQDASPAARPAGSPVASPVGSPVASELCV